MRDGKRDFGEDQGREWARSLELERGERKGGNGPRKGIKNRLNKEPGNRVEEAKGDKTKKKGLSY